MLLCTENRIQNDLRTISDKLNFALKMKFKLNIDSQIYLEFLCKKIF